MHSTTYPTMHRIFSRSRTVQHGSEHTGAGPDAPRRPTLGWPLPCRIVGTLALAAGLLGAAAPRPAQAQWSTTYEQFYLQAKHNWVFRNQYRGADRLFNAFDYGHAVLYEMLWTQPNAPASELEDKKYDYLTSKVLVSPPHVPLEEAAIQVAYAKLAPEAKGMFDWAHILHRQLYDVLADERLDQTAKDREIARLIAYYKTRPDLAFSSRPKSMKLMQEQPYSLAFRQKYPKFNGLIWAYHWMQVGLYEPLVVGRTAEERQAGVRATVARFWQMLGDPPRTLPYQMPMTPAIAPRFTERYPEAAILFDNLHSMHDVVSDILANPSVPRDRKRAEILLAARRFRDDTSYVMPVAAWRTMAHHMGIENMGGPSVDFLTALPAPTVTYGAVMQHDDRTGAMTGFAYGHATGAAHGAPGGHAMSDTVAMDSSAAAHAGHGAGVHDSVPDTMHPGAAQAHDMDAMHGPGGERHATQMMELHERMMEDPVIRRRMLADTAMRRMMQTMMADAPAAHREHMERMMREADAGRTTAPAARPRSSHAGRTRADEAKAKPPAKATRKRATPEAPPAAKHGGHQMPMPPAPATKPHAEHRP
jgi:hypothetical protein